MLRKMCAGASLVLVSLVGGPVVFADDVTPSMPAEEYVSEQEQVQESLEEVSEPAGTRMIIVDGQNTGIFVEEGGSAWQYFSDYAGTEIYSPEFVDILNSGGIQVDAQFAGKKAEEMFLALGLQGPHTVSLGEDGPSFVVNFPITDTNPATAASLPETADGDTKGLGVAGVAVGGLALLGVFTFAFMKFRNKKTV